ncbi:cupin domain-containing protein [Mariniflexile litorale]|uniref:Cupin domain-containing protein n=1 Tax=Mariniflexile litorale TaxID=3045158 RepID=A0AAU7EHC9_9FLAO|nr:cupin domain-containing protein [Mariniflexile sp. KMM 9835]MDQ8210678.1 cupin domain-containing protein [Mariniflexile sp. KMM 9835]
MKKSNNEINKMTPKIVENEMEKAAPHIVVEIIQYIPNAVVSKTIIKKINGNITAVSFDVGEELAEKTSPFDTYIQIIDGTASLTINKKEYELGLGQGIIIPSNERHHFTAKEQFKMISTVIKSGYEAFD